MTFNAANSSSLSPLVTYFSTLFKSKMNEFYPYLLNMYAQSMHKFEKYHAEEVACGYKHDLHFSNDNRFTRTIVEAKCVNKALMFFFTMLLVSHGTTTYISETKKTS